MILLIEIVAEEIKELLWRTKREKNSDIELVYRCDCEYADTQQDTSFSILEFNNTRENGTLLHCRVFSKIY